MSSSKAAKHAEIAHRYAWHARHKRQGVEPIASIRWPELARVFRGRLGGNMSRAELERHILEAAGGDWMSCGAWVLGKRIDLTLAERMRHDVRTIRATDKKMREIKEAYKARRREQDRERKRKLRDQLMENTNMNHDLNERQETLYALLRASGKWMTVRQMAATVRNWSAWKRPDGGRLKSTSLHTLVRRDLDRLQHQDMIEQTRKLTPNGLPERRVRVIENPIKHRVRTKTVRANTRTGGVRPRKPARSADGMRVSERTEARKNRVRTSLSLDVRTANARNGGTLH